MTPEEVKDVRIVEFSEKDRRRLKEQYNIDIPLVGGRSLSLKEVLHSGDNIRESLHWVERNFSDNKRTMLSQTYPVNSRFEKAISQLYKTVREERRYPAIPEETSDCLLMTAIAYYATRVGGTEMLSPKLIENLTMAASRFILDYCGRHKECIEPVMDILNEGSKYYEDTPEDDIPTVLTESYHPAHMRQAYKIIKYRNREALSQNKEESRRTNNELLNCITAQEEQKNKKYQDRQMFDRLMALIPEDVKQQCYEGLKEIIMDRQDLMFASIRDIDQEIVGKLDAVNRALKEFNDACEGFTRKKLDETGEMVTKVNNQTAIMPNPLLRNPVSMDDKVEKVRAQMSQMQTNKSFLGAPVDSELMETAKVFGTVVKLTKNLNSLYEELQELVRKRNMQMISIMMIADAQNTPDYYTKCNSKSLPEEEVLLTDPYATAFGLLWALETGKDEAWLGGFTDQVCFLLNNQLPWTRSLSSLYFQDHSDQKESPREDAVDEKAADEWKSELYRPERAHLDEKLGKVLSSTAMLVYRHTGHLLPDSNDDYASVEKYYRDYLRFGYTPQEAFLLSCIVRIYRDMDETVEEICGFVYGKQLGETKDGAAQEETPEQLKEKLNALKQKCEALTDRAYNAERALRDKQEEMESLRREHTLERNELVDLREMIFNLQSPAEEEEPDEKAYSFPYEVARRTLVFGGHKTWLKEIRQKLTGNISFYEDKVFDQRIIQNADVIWIQTNAISHSMYYRIIDQARMYDKQVKYFTKASAINGAVQIMKEDQENG